MSFYHIFENSFTLIVTGKDSRRYLNARLANNIKNLMPGETIRAACLSPQGKTEGLFDVYCENNEGFILYASGGDPDKVTKAFKRFIVADQVNVSIDGKKHLITDSSQNLSGFQSAQVQRNNYKLILVSFAKDQQTEIIELMQNHNISSLTNNEFHTLKCLQFGPDFPDEITPDSLFAESGLNSAYSCQKGCYTGQEVMERVIALGKLPAVILAFKTKTLLNIEEKKLFNEAGEEVGGLLSESINLKTAEKYLFARVKNSAQNSPVFLKFETGIQELVKLSF